MFSEEKVYNYWPDELDENQRLSRSIDSFSRDYSNNIEEFLKGSTQSFLNNDYSFKHSDSLKDSANLCQEISRDNPLDMDSNIESKQLVIEDLEVHKDVKDSINEYYEEEKTHQNHKEKPSRNEEKHLSRDNSSLWNFKSIDITNNSYSSVTFEDIEKAGENSGAKYCHSPVQKEK